MKVEDINLLEVSGGGISASVLNYLSTVVKTFYSIGQDLGGAIRRIATGRICPL